MVDRTVRVRVTANNADFDRAMGRSAATTDTLTRRLEAADGRMAALIQTGLAIAPALAPIGAEIVPAVVGLTTQLGFAVGAAGVAVLAFQGVGDAVKSLNAYALAPTEANLEKVRQTMAQLGPAAADFARFTSGQLTPALHELQNVAASGIFPGFQSGIQSVLTQLPEVERVITAISTAAGGIARGAGDALASGRFDTFFTYLENDARPILTQFAKAVGNFVEGTANLFVAFNPLERDFSRGLLDMAEAFNRWASGVDQSQGFQNFIDYVERNGPAVLTTLESLGSTLISIAEAAAPVGQSLLPVITILSDFVGSIANSSLGPVIIGAAAAIGALGRSLALFRAVGLRGEGQGLLGNTFNVSAMRAARSELRAIASQADRTSVSLREFRLAYANSANVRSATAGFARGAAAIGGVALISSGATDKLHVMNTVSLALAGSIAGPEGAIAGGLVGAAMDLNAAFDKTPDAAQAAAQQTKYLQDVIASGGPSSVGQIKALREEIGRLRVEGERIATTAGVGSLIKDVAGQANTAQIDSLKGALHNMVTQGDLDKQQRLIDDLHQVDLSARQTAMGFVDVGQAVANATNKGRVSLDKFMRQLEQQASAMRNFRVNTQAAMAKGLSAEAVQALAKLGPAGAQIMAKLAHSSRQAVQQMNGDFQSLDRQTRLLSGALAGVGEQLGKITRKTWQVNLGVDAAGANAVLNGIEFRLNRLRAGVRIPIHAANAVATGGMIRGPGGPTDDRIPAMLSNGEYVVRAAAVQRYGESFLHSLNAMRLAQGGSVVERRPTYSVPVPVATPVGSTTNYYNSGSDASAMRALKTELAKLRETVAGLGTDVYDGARDGTAGRVGRTANRRRPGG